jgi:hypothetical protein
MAANRPSGRAAASAERAREYRQTRAPLRRRGAVCVAQGHGLRIAVEHGRLCVTDGAGAQRRRRVYNRAEHGLARLVVIGSAGSVSLEALRWLADLGIGFLHLRSARQPQRRPPTTVASANRRCDTAAGTETARRLPPLRRLDSPSKPGQDDDVVEGTKIARTRSFGDAATRTRVNSRKRLSVPSTDGLSRSR